MSRKMLMIGFGALAATLTTHANADLITAASIAVPFDQAIVKVEFLGSDASWNGDLYFLGFGGISSITDPVDEKENGIGQFLFDNHTAMSGDMVMLEGVFNQGDILHFGYNIKAPNEHLDFFTTAESAGKEQFKYDINTGHFFIEDIRTTSEKFDDDYNDIMVRITFMPVPGPGSLALLLIAGGMITRKRRRIVEST